MTVRFSVSVDPDRVPADSMMVRDRQFRKIEKELEKLTGRRVEIFDDTQFERVQISFSPA